MNTTTGYDSKLDGERLSLQIGRIFGLMSDGQYRTLREISESLEILHRPAIFLESSVGAQLRNLRRAPYNYCVTKRRRGEIARGLYEYRVEVAQRNEAVGQVQAGDDCARS